MIYSLTWIEKDIVETITDELDKVGILYRIFSRIKNTESIKEKIARKAEEGYPYKEGGKLMQDIIGIRVVTYFKDDVEIVYSLLKKKLGFCGEQIDDHDLTVFKPKRTNVICRFNKKQSEDFNDDKKILGQDIFPLIDNTFELQLRTMLSEGWHEIDHNMRYKCKKDWEQYAENERLLNGIYASLETNDIALKGLFNELAYKHYKSSNWEGLIRNKMRLRFQQESINTELIKILNNNQEIGKQILRLDREELIKKICQINFTVPINLNNIIFLINIYNIKDVDILKITPVKILNDFNN